VVGTFGVSAYLPWIVSDKDPISAQGLVQGQHQGSSVVSEAFGHTAVVVVPVGQYVEGKDRAVDRDALVAADNLVAVATELGLEGVALVLDDIHLLYLHHLSYSVVVSDTHLVVLEEAFAASRR
jgi:hypothetical protein